MSDSAASRGAPRAYLLSYSPIPDDPRVRRVGDLLHANGWDVVGIGLSGWRSAAPDWPVRQIETGQPAAAPNTILRNPLADMIRRSPLRPLARVAYGLATTLPMRARRRMALTIGSPEAIERDCFWPSHGIVRGLRDLALAESEPGLWIANDWPMLPIAAAAAQVVGGVYTYDSHEFAIEEYAQDRNWRRNQRPVAAAVEGRHIRGARLVTSVSPDITSELARMYDLKAPTETIRNVPSFEPHEFRPTGERIRMLYHGIVAPGRGLEESIDSVSLWRDEFELTIRGPSSPAPFAEQLQARIRARGLSQRVKIVPPVPMTQLVSAAAPYDVGMMALAGHSAHNRFALPNKIFEYMMAGLALCVSDLDSMRALVDETKAGVTIGAVKPEAIAAAVNGLTRESIDSYKRAALAAAGRYNWQREGVRLLNLLETISADIPTRTKTPGAV